MTENIYWLSEDQTSLWMEFDKGWTWNDFREATIQAHQMIETVPHKAVLVVWYKAGMPTSPPLTHFVTASRSTPQNVAAVVVIAHDNALLNFLKNLDHLTTRLDLIPLTVRFVKSADEAQALIPTFI